MEGEEPEDQANTPSSFPFAVGDVITRLTNLKEVHDQITALLPDHFLFLEGLCGSLRYCPGLVEIHTSGFRGSGHLV